MSRAALSRHTPTRIMGVLNVTPDSFSDGGQFFEPNLAIARGREMVAQGAHLIDVGGESTRPGAVRVAPEEEQRRVLPVIAALAHEGIAISIDTVHAETARLAVAAGASLINDVSGGTADPAMLRVAAETGADYLIMHWRGIPDLQHVRSTYSDVVEEVRGELAALAEGALAAGVSPEKLILDPGFGFDKTTEQGWQLLASVDRFATLGYPLLIGVSRKRMLAETLREGATPDDRDLATAAVSAMGARAGIWGVRVHNVKATATALKVARAWNTAETQLQETHAGQRGPRAYSVPGRHRSEGRGQSGAPDRITLTGLEVFAHHGVFDFEREQGQKFIIDAEVSVDLRAAAADDELARTVHYGHLAEAILEAVAHDPVDLIETLAERVATVALGFPGVTKTLITVHKPHAPINAKFGDVSVTIVREKRPQ